MNAIIFQNFLDEHFPLRPNVHLKKRKGKQCKVRSEIKITLA